MAQGKSFIVGRAEEIAAGERKLVTVDGKQIGIFHVDGRVYAFLNYCPHSGGALCEGPLTGTTLPADDFQFVYGRAGQVLRCAWHGWEFDIATGEFLLDPQIRARRYPVAVNAAGEIVLQI